MAVSDYIKTNGNPVIVEYAKEIEIDNQLTALNAVEKQRDLFNIIHKWHYRNFLHKTEIRELELKIEDMAETAILNDPQRAKISNAKIIQKLKSSPEYKEIIRDIQFHKEVVDYLTGEIDTFRAMNFGLKNLTDQIKLELDI